MEPIFNAILKDTYSLFQLKHRLNLLRTYLLSQLFTSEAAKPNIEVGDLNWLNSLGADFFKSFNKDNVYKIMDQLAQKFFQIEPLIIFLPFDVDDSATRLIGLKLRNTFKIPLFDVKLNPSLIAGCALSYKGVLRDYSLKAQIEQRKAEIINSFKKYLR